MTDDELRALIERECGPVQRMGDMLWAVEVARVAMAAERERCAKLCEDISDEYQQTEGRRHPELRTDAQEGASKCAAAIRSQP